MVVATRLLLLFLNTKCNDVRYSGGYMDLVKWAGNRGKFGRNDSPNEISCLSLSLISFFHNKQHKTEMVVLLRFLLLNVASEI